jgi:hypothetical protein
MNWLDEMFSKSAVGVAQRVSRRQFGRTLGRATAGLIFAGTFGKLFFGGVLKMSEAEAACVPVDANCGLAGRSCSCFFSTCDCANNCQTPDGCPKGTVLGVNTWHACCPCVPTVPPTVPPVGRIALYQDCCGVPDADCTRPVAAGGFGCSRCPPNVRTEDCEEGSTHNWCGNGMPVYCTITFIGGECPL